MTKTLLSKTFYKTDSLINQIDLLMTYTGTITFMMSNNAENLVPTWKTSTIVSGELKVISFSSTGTVMKYQVLGATGSIINSLKIFM